MKTGYARVSTEDQNLDVQLQALKEAGCKRIYQEKVSGASNDREQLNQMMNQLREGDTVIVWRLDRLARSTRKLLEITDKLRQAGVNFRSLSEPWADTASAAGRMVMTVFAGIAEFERDLIVHRTSSGRYLAQQRGVKFGRPSKLAFQAQTAEISFQYDYLNIFIWLKTFIQIYPSNIILYQINKDLV